MWRKNLCVAVAAVAVLGLAACDPEDIIDTDEEFSATLTGDAEVPSVETTATGSAEFDVDDGVVAFSIDVSGLTGATGAHIHGPAAAGTNADVIVGLFAGPQGGTGTITGELESGTFDVGDFADTSVSMDSLLVLMRNGNAYVNVHTIEHPGGEIRGQIQDD